MFIERYSHVMHLVSTIEGKLRPELTGVDALRACFPAGTLSGAPKVRAMEIIEELEPSRRGTYGGAVLYADFSGNLDSCIAIRSLLARNGKGSIQAGAGIVADSVPELEYKESMNKARAVLRAIERAQGTVRRDSVGIRGVPPSRQKKGAKMGHGSFVAGWQVLTARRAMGRNLHLWLDRPHIGTD